MINAREGVLKFGLNLNEPAELLGLTICGLGARNCLRNHIKLV
jgi:hypothetical protein